MSITPRSGSLDTQPVGDVAVPVQTYQLLMLVLQLPVVTQVTVAASCKVALVCAAQELPAQDRVIDWIAVDGGVGVGSIFPPPPQPAIKRAARAAVVAMILLKLKFITPPIGSLVGISEQSYRLIQLPKSDTNSIRIPSFLDLSMPCFSQVSSLIIRVEP